MAQERGGGYDRTHRADGESDRSTQTRSGRTPVACEYVNAKNNKALARMLGCVNPARWPAAFFWGWISAQREQSNRLAATLAEAPQIGTRRRMHGFNKGVF